MNKKIEIVVVIIIIAIAGVFYSLNKQKTQNPTTTIPSIKNQQIEKHKNGCDFLKNFENDNWFNEMLTLHQNKLPKETDGKFYLDYFKFNKKQGCLYSDNFIFVPFEDLTGGGPLYLYNIINKKFIEAPSNEKYYNDELMDINNDYVLFKGGGGSGECFYENHGKYYYNSNEVELFKECDFCMKSIPDEKDCKNINIIYK